MPESKRRINLEERAKLERAPTYYKVVGLLERKDTLDDWKKRLEINAVQYDRIAALYDIGFDYSHLVKVTRATRESINLWAGGARFPDQEFDTPLRNFGIVVSKLVVDNELDPEAAIKFVTEPVNHLQGLSVIEAVRDNPESAFEYVEDLMDMRSKA